MQTNLFYCVVNINAHFVDVIALNINTFEA